MRPYTFDSKLRDYRVPQPLTPAVGRKTRLAAGMSYTYGRNKSSRLRACFRREDKPDVLSLVVYGTTAKGFGFGFKTERAPCPCCGSKTAGKLRLNDSGRLRLRALRRKKEERA